jgi:hypothetical protein
MWGTIILAAALLVAAGLLLARHLIVWRRADHGGLADRDYEFHRRQYRRRMQTSGLLGLVGLLMLGSLWIDDPLVGAVYWAGIAALVIWIALLAMTDWLASRLYYGRLAADQAVEHAAIKAEIARFHREQSDIGDEPPAADPSSSE